MMLKNTPPFLTAFAVAVACGSGSPAAAQDRPLRTVKDGLLDEIKLYADKLPSSGRIVIRSFSATDADIVEGEKKEETKTMQADGPRMLSEHFISKLKELKSFADVSALESAAAAPSDALLVEGKFTELDPGSRAKRYFGGFGAGKSAVTIVGSVKSADGTVLATFQHRRIGTMGAFGGDSLGKLAADTKSLGEDVAKFVDAWATGKKLK